MTILLGGWWCCAVYQAHHPWSIWVCCVIHFPLCADPEQSPSHSSAQSQHHVSIDKMSVCGSAYIWKRKLSDGLFLDACWKSQRISLISSMMKTCLIMFACRYDWYLMCWKLIWVSKSSKVGCERSCSTLWLGDGDAKLVWWVCMDWQHLSSFSCTEALDHARWYSFGYVCWSHWWFGTYAIWEHWEGLFHNCLPPLILCPRTKSGHRFWHIASVVHYNTDM